MKNIPSGNVTFLFTDIEGSTKLAQAHPEKLPSALIRHNEILRDAIESNNGHVFKIVGDAYCCAFENAEDAVKAAIEVQRNLSEEKWDESEIKIRVGIHSGIAEWNGQDYMGYMTLARTARVMSAAYGEQIIVSNDAYEIYKENLVKEKDFSFRDLGERRLKDVIEPIRLYQVLSKDLREEFPPLMTLDARPNNLPIQLTSFIGRERDMKDVKDKLRQNRLLTLTGTGGAGKSRFSLQAGADLIDDFANGVWLVELAAVSDPDF
ncbi:MAG: adenylate/guanylate cyclase domain-containing protein [Ignavibacteria bacterium]|nr:adenylate/guanylate cyclase domain-containing protein [Ignavibacteria bacterium]